MSKTHLGVRSDGYPLSTTRSLAFSLVIEGHRPCDWRSSPSYSGRRSSSSCSDNRIVQPTSTSSMRSCQRARALSVLTDFFSFVDLSSLSTQRQSIGSPSQATKLRSVHHVKLRRSLLVIDQVDRITSSSTTDHHVTSTSSLSSSLIIFTINLLVI